MPRLPYAFVLILLMFGLTFSGGFVFHSNAASQTLYGCNSAGTSLSSLYTINAATGAATLVGSMGSVYGCSGLAYYNGNLYATGQDGSSSGTTSLFTIDPATGAATLVGASNQGTSCTYHITDIDFSPSGTLYATFENCLATLNSSTGAETDIATITGSLYNAGNALAISSSGTLYFAEKSLYTLNPSTGAATTIATLSNLPTGCTSGKQVANALKFSSSGTLYGVFNCGSSGSGPNYLVTINTTTGAMTTVGQTQNGLDGIAFVTVPSVPEFPILQLSLPLLFLAGIVLYLMIRKYISYPRISSRPIGNSFSES